MTLDTPNNEQCGNCHFCSSFIREEQKPNGFLQPPIKITNEIFLCKRYPPIGDLVGRSILNERKFIIESSTSPRVNSKYWCGEWKQRKGGIIKS